MNGETDARNDYMAFVVASALPARRRLIRNAIPKYMTPVHQDDMTGSRVVAIWIGDHRDELDLDQYMMERFEVEYGFTMNERRMPETDTRPEPVPVAELLKGFSMWESWYDSALFGCAKLEIDCGASAVVFHFLRFSPERCKVAEMTGLRFVGNFDWPEISKG